MFSIYIEAAQKLKKIPAFLYHATYKPLLKRIKSEGLNTKNVKQLWTDSKPGIVYLAKTKDIAESYAETNDIVPDEWLDQIVVLRINTKNLNKLNFNIDRNVINNNGDTIEYHGVISASNFEIIS